MREQKQGRARRAELQQAQAAASQQQQQQQQRAHVYDQNWNLQLDEQAKDEQQSASGLEHKQQQVGAGDSRSSPELSLLDSECTTATSSSSASERAFGSPPAHLADSSSGDESTQRACSAAESLQAGDEPAQEACARCSDHHHNHHRRDLHYKGENNNNDNHHHHHHKLRPAERQVAFDGHVLIDVFELDSAAKASARLAPDGAGELATGAPRREPASLANRLARGVSLFPAALLGARDAAKTDGERRVSLPLPGLLCARQPSLSSASSQLGDEAADSLVAAAVAASAAGSDRAAAGGAEKPSAPEPTVAGVGGTVTTVTRKKRKTAPLPRLVAKHGQVNLFFDNIDRRQYYRDLFVTMIDIKWRYNLAAAAFGFVLSWLFFACVWYLVLFVHDDLNHEHDPQWSPCIVNVYSFAAALLFSIETQSTLGFGSRIISVECPGAILIFCAQLIFGVVIECLIVGMVFAKLTRPAKRSQTIMYSKCATVCLREDQLCLTFRVGDVRSKSHIIGATIRASLVSQKITREGEIIPFCHNQLKVTIDNSESLLLIWPVTIVHQIDQSSPFYELSAQQLANFKFELITVLEGTVESTGQSIQVRSSYLPSEVKWGYRFEPIVSAHGFGRYAQTIIDYNKFNRLVEVDTPTCSARQYYASRQLQPPPPDTSNAEEAAQ